MKTYSNLHVFFGIVLGLFCLSGCVINPGSFFHGSYSTDECSFTLNRFTGTPIKWDEKELPVTFYVHQSVPIEAQDNFISAVHYWNMRWSDYLEDRGVQGKPLFEVIENQWALNEPKNDSYNMLFFLNDFSKYGRPGTQAVTVASSKGSSIKDTDIIVNESQFNFYYDENYNQSINLAFQKRNSIRNISSSFQLSLYERIKLKFLSFFKSILNLFISSSLDRQLAAHEASVPQGFVDFPSLMIHELGHVPGLGHVEKTDIHRDYHSMRRASLNPESAEKEKISPNSSVMHPKLPQGFSRRRINEFDLNNLYCGYYKYKEKQGKL